MNKIQNNFLKARVTIRLQDIRFLNIIKRNGQCLRSRKLSEIDKCDMFLVMMLSNSRDNTVQLKVFQIPVIIIMGKLLHSIKINYIYSEQSPIYLPLPFPQVLISACYKETSVQYVNPKSCLTFSSVPYIL